MGDRFSAVGRFRQRRRGSHAHAAGRSEHLGKSGMPPSLGRKCRRQAGMPSTPSPHNSDASPVDCANMPHHGQIALRQGRGRRFPSKRYLFCVAKKCSSKCTPVHVAFINGMDTVKIRSHAHISLSTLALDYDIDDGSANARRLRRCR